MQLGLSALIALALAWAAAAYAVLGRPTTSRMEAASTSAPSDLAPVASPPPFTPRRAAAPTLISLRPGQTTGAPKLAPLPYATDRVQFARAIASTLWAAESWNDERAASVLATADPGIDETARQALVASIDAIRAQRQALAITGVDVIPGGGFSQGDHVLVKGRATTGAATITGELDMTVRCAPGCVLLSLATSETR